MEKKIKVFLLKGDTKFEIFNREMKDESIDTFTFLLESVNAFGKMVAGFNMCDGFEIDLNGTVYTYKK